MKLGDTLEDWCPRCRLLLDHNVAAMVGDEVKKVVCNTCFTEHAYRHGKGGRKKETVKDLFHQVLRTKVNGDDPDKKRGLGRSSDRKRQSAR